MPGLTAQSVAADGHELGLEHEPVGRGGADGLFGGEDTDSALESGHRADSCVFPACWTRSQHEHNNMTATNAFEVKSVLETTDSGYVKVKIQRRLTTPSTGTSPEEASVLKLSKLTPQENKSQALYETTSRRTTDAVVHADTVRYQS